MVDQALAAPDTGFGAVCANSGRPSIPSRFLLRAWLAQIVYAVRPEPLLSTRIDHKLLLGGMP